MNSFGRGGRKSEGMAYTSVIALYCQSFRRSQLRNPYIVSLASLTQLGHSSNPLDVSSADDEASHGCDPQEEGRLLNQKSRGEERTKKGMPTKHGGVKKYT